MFDWVEFYEMRVVKPLELYTTRANLGTGNDFKLG
jgi:hypothetical protein